MKLNQYTWDPEKDLIAEGSFAEVFKALDTNTQGRVVALKIYKEAVAKGTQGSSNQKKYSLEEEFRKIDGLSHTNIITYYGQSYMEHKDAMGRSSSYPLIVMEYAEHGTLSDFLKTKPNAGIIDKLIKEIIHGVAYLHSEGILHRDLKPGNILITSNRKGEPVAKITDFGISRDLLDEAETLERSMTAGVGTPHYMAPEQFFKNTFGLNGEISERTDIWAIGVIVYKAIIGHLPFGSGDYEQVRSQIIGQNPKLEGLKAYESLVMASLMKKAEQRPLAALDLLPMVGLMPDEALRKNWETQATAQEAHPVALHQGDDKTILPETIVDEEATLVKPTGGISPKPVDPPKKKRTGAILAGALAVIALIIAVAYFTQPTDEQTGGEKAVELMNDMLDDVNKGKDDSKTDSTANNAAAQINGSTSEKEEDSKTAGSANSTPASTTTPRYSLLKNFTNMSAGEELAVNNENKLLLTQGGGKVILLNSETGEVVKRITPPAKLGRSAISNGSKPIIATSGREGEASLVTLIDYDTGRELWRTTVKDNSETLAYFNSMIFSPDDKYLALWTNDYTIIINTETRQSKTIPYGAILFRDPAFSPDSQLFAIPHNGSKDIVIYSLAEGQVKSILPRSEYAHDIVFFPDNARVAYTSGKNVRILDTRTNLLQKTIEFNSDPRTDLDGLAISNGGSVIAASGSSVGGVIKLFDVQGIMISQFKAHTGYVNRIRFSKYGKRIFSASDGTQRNPVRIWASPQSIAEGLLPSLPRLQPAAMYQQPSPPPASKVKEETKTSTAIPSEASLWSKALSSGSRTDYETYLTEYPNGKNAPAANFVLGNTYYNGATGTPRNYSKAYEYTKKSADAGNAAAQNLLSNMYWAGNGVNQDYNESVYWARKSADQNYASGQHMLANHYYRGRGVKGDGKEAIALYTKAANQGITSSQYMLGHIYHYGQGVDKDQKTAAQWYLKAADNGHKESIERLSVIYEYDGFGDNLQDDTQLAKWLKKAAEMGSIDAQMTLGKKYLSGQRRFGVNTALSKKYYQMACNQGNSEACSKVKIVDSYITVKGLVTDKKGDPLPGANIIHKGTINGGATDTDGKYEITVPANGVLVFSFAKLKTQEIAVASRKEINVQMKRR